MQGFKHCGADRNGPDSVCRDLPVGGGHPATPGSLQIRAVVRNRPNLAEGPGLEKEGPSGLPLGRQRQKLAWVVFHR